MAGSKAEEEANYSRNGGNLHSTRLSSNLRTSLGVFAGI